MLPPPMASQSDLVQTMRTSARWRKDKAREFAEDKVAAHRSNRASVAIQTAAKFVEALPPDDRDLVWLRLVDADRRGALLCEEARDLLARFGMDRGAWQSGRPDERQMRNLLRRMAGAESRERAAYRRDAT